MAGRAEFDEIAGLLGDILAGAARRVGLASVCAPSSRGACEPSGGRTESRRADFVYLRDALDLTDGIFPATSRCSRPPLRADREDVRRAAPADLGRSHEGRPEGFASEVAALRTLIAIVDRRTAPKEVRKECG